MLKSGRGVLRRAVVLAVAGTVGSTGALEAKGAGASDRAPEAVTCAEALGRDSTSGVDTCDARAETAEDAPHYTTARRSPRPPELEPPFAVAEPPPEASPPVEPAPTPHLAAPLPTPPVDTQPPLLEPQDGQEATVEETTAERPGRVIAGVPATLAPPVRLAATGTGRRPEVVAAGILLAVGGLAIALGSHQRGVGLPPGHQRGPRSGHQRGLFHGHGHSWPTRCRRQEA